MKRLLGRTRIDADYTRIFAEGLKGLVVLSLVVALTGCPKKKKEPQTGGGTGDLPQAVLTSIVVSPTSAILPKNKTQQFTAVCKDQNGNTMTGITLTWVSSNASNVSISATGLVTALKDYFDLSPNAEPTASITASAGGITSNGAQITNVVNIEGNWGITESGGSEILYYVNQTGGNIEFSTTGLTMIGSISNNSVSLSGTSAGGTNVTYNGTIASTRTSMSGTYTKTYPDGATASGSWSATKK